MQISGSGSTILRDETIKFLIAQNSSVFDALSGCESEVKDLSDRLAEMRSSVNEIQSTIATKTEILQDITSARSISEENVYRMNV
jgi:hypothetical protein